MSDHAANFLPTIVFDGQCGFCRKQIARIQRWGGLARFEFLPAQAPDLRERFPRLAEGDLSSGLRVVEPGGTVHVGADAVYAVARRLPRTAWFAWLYRVPVLHWSARTLYGWVAANRYRLSRRCEEGCVIPPDRADR